MQTVNIHAARTQLSRLVDEVSTGKLMCLLLDTHVLLWTLGDPARLDNGRGPGQRGDVQRRQHLGDRHQGPARVSRFRSES